MSVHQSPRRHSARSQNTYEDGTDEDEQHLLQPADRYDRRRSDYGRPSSPQDQDPRHTQLHTPARKFADRHYAANDVPSGPNPDASLPTYLVGEHLSGTEHADPTYLVGDAALPLSQHHSIPSARHRPQTPSVQRSSDMDNERPPPPAGYYYSDSPYPQPTTHEARTRSTPQATNCHATRATQEPLAPLAALPTSAVAYGLGGHASFAAKQSADAACRAEHQYHPQQQLIASVPGGGRGLSSLPFDPTESYADLEQKSAFYRNAAPYKPLPNPYAWKPLDLPTFDGDIRKYPRFREAFDQVYGSHPDLRPQNKLLYLRMHLSGEALAFAESYMVTDANYTNVVKLLEEKYGNKFRLGSTLLMDLVNVRQPSEALEELRRFYQEVHSLQSLLQYAGETWDNPSIAMMIATKLPKSVRLKLVDSYGYRPDNCETTVLLECLGKYLANLDWASTELRLTEEPTNDALPRHSVAVDTSDLTDLPCRDGPEFTAIGPAVKMPRVPAAVATTIADEPLQERRTCPLCGLLHSAADCIVYDTTKKRLRRVQKLKMCILCLREGHPAASCPRRTPHPCKICRHGQHNRALCMVAIDDRPRTDRHPSQVRATKGSNIDPEASDQQRHSRTTAPAGSNIRSAQQSVNRDVTNTVPTATPMRQSGTQSSLGHIHGNLMNRKKRPKDLGTDPLGRPGTNRPPTTSTDESMKQNGADAYGRDRSLPGRHDLLRTDRCLTKREMLQLDRGYINGSADAEYQHELYDEDASHQPFDGHRDAVLDWTLDVPDEDRSPHYEESTVYVACASDSEQPAVLHECLSVTAMNPASKKSCRAIIMFDSGSSSSHVSSKLARLLNLPHGEMRVQSVNTFGSKTPMAVNGFRTFLALCSSHGRRLQVHVTVSDCIVPSVRTALVRDADLPALRRNDCTPTPTREMPDLLIGQDLVHLFDRHLEPTLPNDFYIVQTSMGPTIGGACRSVTPPGRLHLRPPELSACQPAYLAGSIADSSAQRPACLPAYLAGDSAACDTNECLEPSTATSSSSGQSSPLPRASGILPRSPQKQLSTNSLDAQLLLLPTYSTTYVEVEDVSAAYLAVGLPRPIQDPLSSTEAELRCSIPPPPTRGNLICASLYDAGSPLQRKTRLRPRLPDHIWQLLGIYTSPGSVTAVDLLLPSDSTFICLLRAERELQLMLMSSRPAQIITTLPISLTQGSYALQLHAKTSATRNPGRLRDQNAHAQASPTDLPCRSVSLSWDMTGNSRDSDLPCRYSRARNRGSPPAPPLDASNTRPKRADHQPHTSCSRNVPLMDQLAAATDTVLISVPPRAPRADRIDQKVLAARRGSVDAEVASKLFSATPCHATRATQEPLEPLAATPPPQCAFCGQLHLSHECHVYASVSQRLNRSRQLELCFTCLREGHHTTRCPTEAKLCKFCSNGSHHRALCRNDVSNHSRATTKSTDTRTVGKKRVNIARVHVNNRNACPPKNDTICFCDGSTFHQFGRQLRSGVRMVETPLYTRADAINFVCSFHPATDVKRVIFWFSSDSASPTHVELVRIVTELSQYYTTHYETIVQYVVVSPSVSSRQDAWTYGIFKYLVQAEVLLLDARLTMLPHDLHVRDINDHQAIDAEVSSPNCRLRTGSLLSSTEDVKYFLREQHQLDLWSYYIVDRQPKLTPATPAALRAPAEAATAALHDNTDAPPAEVAAYLAVSKAARVYQPTSIVADNRHSPRAARPPPPADNVSAPTVVLEHLDVPTTRNAFSGLPNIADRQRDEPKAPTLSSTLGRSTSRPADQDFDEPGLVKDATYLVVSETPAAPSQTEAVTYLATAKVQAPPPTSTNIVEQNPRVLDITAATDAGTTLELPATPDAATPSITDAPTIAASAASFHRQRGPSNRRRRHRDQGPAPQAHGLDDRTEHLDAIAEQGP